MIPFAHKWEEEGKEWGMKLLSMIKGGKLQTGEGSQEILEGVYDRRGCWWGNVAT